MFLAHLQGQRETELRGFQRLTWGTIPLFPQFLEQQVFRQLTELLAHTAGGPAPITPSTDNLGLPQKHGQRWSVTWRRERGLPRELMRATFSSITSSGSRLGAHIPLERNIWPHLETSPGSSTMTSAEMR